VTSAVCGDWRVLLLFSRMGAPGGGRGGVPRGKHGTRS
jgi:hypothetical protein